MHPVKKYLETSSIAVLTSSIPSKFAKILFFFILVYLDFFFLLCRCIVPPYDCLLVW